MSGFRKTGIHPLNPGSIHDRVTAPSKAIEASEESEIITSPASTSSLENPSHFDTSDSVNSLETHCHSDSVSQNLSSIPKSPCSSLCDAMDTLLMKPKLTRQSQRNPGKSYNSLAVCITDDEFFENPKDTEKKQNKGGAKKEQVYESPHQLERAKEHRRCIMRIIVNESGDVFVETRARKKHSKDRREEV